MRAAVLHGVGDVRIEEVPDPVAEPDQVVIDVAHNGICGSDLSIIDAMGPLTGSPQILGHEFSGTIREVGAEVEGWQVGDRVMVQPNYYCGECDRCRAGYTNICESISFHGVMAPGGGMASMTAVPAFMLHRLPDELTLEQGALVEPLAVALHAIRQTQIQAGQLAVVIGAGPVGLSTALNLRALGVDDVLISEPAPERRRIARGLSLDVIDPDEHDVVVEARSRSGGAGADAVFECAGLQATFDQALAVVRAHGDISLVATYKTPLQLETTTLLFTEAKLSSALAYLPEDVETVIAQMVAGHYPLTGWVSHVPLDDAIQGGIGASRDGRAMKVLVDL